LQQAFLCELTGRACGVGATRLVVAAVRVEVGVAQGLHEGQEAGGGVNHRHEARVALVKAALVALLVKDGFRGVQTWSQVSFTATRG